jgi:acetyl-CoA C-acetyltransferase
MLGAGSISLGDAEMVIAGGMENMSQAPYLLKKARAGYRLGHGEIFDMLVYDGLQDPYSGSHMGEIADARSAHHGISRTAQDDYAIRSYRLAQLAIAEGAFADEIVPVSTTGRKGPGTVSRDEEPFKVDFAKLPALRPVFSKDGTATAGNSSTINDGAAIVLLAGETAVKKHGLVPLARVAASATHSLDPSLFPDAPVGAMDAVCRKAGVRLQDIDLFEINEAFSSVPLIAINELHLDPNRVNVNGGAVAIGHPIGASGGRLAVTLAHTLHRRHLRYGIASLCIGGGEAVAMILERV